MPSGSAAVLMESAALLSRPCPICGRLDGSKLLFEARIDPARLSSFSYASRKVPELMHHALRECCACGDIFASPAPSPEFLAQMYREASFDAGSESMDAARSYYKSLVRMARAAGHDLMKNEHCLDVGAGDGAFISCALDAGWRGAFGIEPSAEPIRQAPPEIRRRLVQSTFRADVVPARAYSLVTCFQTLSHAPDPLAIAKTAHQILAPGGCFFVAEHDWRAPLNRLLGRKSPIYDIEHLQLFEPRSIKALFHAAGFQQVRVAPLVNRYPFSYWLRIAPVPAKLKSWVGQAPSLAWLRSRMISIPAGNMSCIGFKAP